MADPTPDPTPDLILVCVDCRCPYRAIELRCQNPADYRVALAAWELARTQWIEATRASIAGSGIVFCGLARDYADQHPPPRPADYRRHA